jgi:DNA polymerase-3 subunit delta'
MAGLKSLPPEIRSLRPVKTLEANLEKGRLAHAILLKGDDLAVLESVSHALAHALLNSQGDPSQHPDFFTLRPAGKSRGIKVGERGKELPNTMRHLIRALNQTSNQGGYKVAVVYEADRMNASAANAFLKTLEEPPPQTVILMLTTRPYELMETIRSRCFQFKIPARLRSAESTDWTTWLDDYRHWIKWLHGQPQEARRQPDKAIMQVYGLITRFVSHVQASSDAAWSEQEETLPDSMSDEEIDALKVGLQKGVRDKLLIEIEENTRLAAIELSHTVPFPALKLAQAIAALESITGLLALNMKDDAALESFFLKSLKIWT